MRHSVFTALALLVWMTSGLVFFSSCAVAPQQAVEAKAAIIDQLNPANPNPDFVARATAILHHSEFAVDYYQGDRITVDLYRRLPGMGYSLIILRAHSGLMGNGTEADQKTCFFTNQAFSPTAEIKEQLQNRLVKAAVDDKPAVFGLGASFVSRSMQPKFRNTAVIMMGCRSLESTDLARAFIEKGASIYTGWNEELGLEYDDDFTLTLLDKLCDNSLSVEAAVGATLQEKGRDPKSGAIPQFYPIESGRKTLGELIWGGGR